MIYNFLVHIVIVNNKNNSLPVISPWPIKLLNGAFCQGLQNHAVYNLMKFLTFVKEWKIWLNSRFLCFCCHSLFLISSKFKTCFPSIKFRKNIFFGYFSICFIICSCRKIYWLTSFHGHNGLNAPSIHTVLHYY